MHRNILRSYDEFVKNLFWDFHDTTAPLRSVRRPLAVFYSEFPLRTAQRFGLALVSLYSFQI